MTIEVYMAYATNQLPEALAGTKLHLFNLVTDSVYRGARKNSAYQFVPQGNGPNGAPGNGGRKWGYAANLPSGAADRYPGDPDPGRYRIYRHIANNRPTWWVLTHLPANTYRFDKITIPKCPGCQGAAEIICPACRGTRTRRDGNFAEPCPGCAGRPTASLDCPACNPGPVIVDGYSVDKNFAHW
jgi:hypothetical protein